ncbi:transporter substrate-binding domain-containing protein [Ramlibacter sp. G-1-2-2]|uniref:Transporter substrate-binding domain-containing protein n=1 Tax=Ramlibacter agri TaxID=2728837 RepID=A0A848HD65_9BURK|nr:transporter substrate-binding domain-containing protein [Ramlibacter agri]NML47409.1 transporter substrate-binding domain-containing protein [Ramlibacter agri]
MLPAFVSVFLLLGAGAAAAQPVDTLKRIAETGTINLGHREAALPFSYYAGQRQVAGYSHELMLRLRDAIQAALALPALTVRLVPVTPQNQVTLVQNGSVDLECAATPHDRERARQLAFSISIFRADTRLLAARDSGIRDFPDLAGKRVAIAGANAPEQLLRERIGRKPRIVAARDPRESFALLEAGRVDAVVMEDAALYAERARSREPERWVVVGTPLAARVYACTMRQGEPELKRIVDAALARMMESGEILRIHAKWFEQPIPPVGLNLRWPASPDLVDLYRHPDDHPLD